MLISIATRYGSADVHFADHETVELGLHSLRYAEDDGLIFGIGVYDSVANKVYIEHPDFISPEGARHAVVEAMRRNKALAHLAEAANTAVALPAPAFETDD